MGDRLSLSDCPNVDDLDVGQQGRNTVVQADNDGLATLLNVTASGISQSTFV